MHPRKLVFALGFFIALAALAAGPSLHAAETPADPDEQFVKEAKVGADNASLLAFLRERSGDDADFQRLSQLVRDLGSEDFETREQASKKLVRLGLVALPAARAAQKDSDQELARRAKSCVEEIERGWQPGLSLAVVRLLVRRQPTEAVETLLRYLPYEADEETAEEIWFGLDSLSLRDGKVQPALVAALKDALAVRRAVAACIVGRRGDQEQKALVRKLLDDKEPMVRLRASQGLLASKDKAGIPVLIALLDEPSVELSWQAEELLHWVAGDEAPELTIGAGVAQQRQKCRKAWEVWWERHGAKLDLSQLDKDYRRPGLILLCDPGSPDQENGRVWLCGCDGKTRWQLNQLSSPSDVQLLAGSRILLAEQSALRPTVKPENVPGVTERDLDGTILWRYQGLRNPAVSRRLANGNTFVAERLLRVAEVTAEGSEIYSRPLHLADDLLRLTGDLKFYQCPQRLSPRRLLCRLERDSCIESLTEFDPVDGQVLKRVTFVGKIKVLPVANVEALTNGNYLIAGTELGCVLEVDATDKTVWKCPMPGSYHALRLRNGNTLIGGSGRVIEVDQAQRVVWEAFFETDVHRLSVCLGLVRLGFDQPRPDDFDLAASIPHRLKGLQSKEKPVRRQTIAYLAEFGARIPGAVPALTALLDDADPALRKDAQEALEKIDASPFARLLKDLKDKDPKVRASTIWRLHELCCDARIVTPLLIEALKDENAKVRAMAANVMVGVKQEAKRVVPELIKAAQDSDPEVRLMAVHSLGWMGAEAKPALPVLLECLKGKDLHLRHWSALTLGRLGLMEETVVPALIEALKDVKARSGAAAALSMFGPKAKTAVPALLEAFEAPVPDSPPHLPGVIRSVIVQAFERIGPDAKAAVPILIKILQNSDNDRGLRSDAARALGEIGAPAKDAVPVLQEACREDYPLGQSATKALVKIQGQKSDR